jgi:uncharacterized protein YbaP (TraB family)
MAVKRKDILESLQEQLAMKGASLDHYVDLLNDYMTLWDTKNALSTDIKKRGVVYKDVSSVGVEMWKNNPSVKELVMVNRQMLTILKELKLSTDEMGGGDEDDL